MSLSADAELTSRLSLISFDPFRKSLVVKFWFCNGFELFDVYNVEFIIDGFVFGEVSCAPSIAVVLCMDPIVIFPTTGAIIMLLFIAELFEGKAFRFEPVNRFLKCKISQLLLKPNIFGA